MKKCKHCGTTENLYSQRTRWGSVVTYKQCIKCRRQQSKETFVKGTLSEEGRQKIIEARSKWSLSQESRKIIGQKNKKNRTGIKLTEEHKKKISLGNLGKIMSEEAKKKISKANKGHTMSKELRKQVSEYKKGNEYNKGKKMSEEAKKKLSKKIKYNLNKLDKSIKNWSCQGKNEKKALDMIEKKLNIKLFRQFPIQKDKYRYHVDGYDKENNVVYEVDELHHFDINDKYTKESEIRMNYIQSKLKCAWVSIKDGGIEM